MHEAAFVERFVDHTVESLTSPIKMLLDKNNAHRLNWTKTWYISAKASRRLRHDGCGVPWWRHNDLLLNVTPLVIVPATWAHGQQQKDEKPVKTDNEQKIIRKLSCASIFPKITIGNKQACLTRSTSVYRKSPPSHNKRCSSSVRQIHNCRKAESMFDKKKLP